MSVHPLLHRQLRDAFGDTIPELPGLRALLDAVASAYATADAERSRFERALHTASEQIAAREDATTLILDHVAQGFVAVGLDGSIGHECSRALTGWFGEPADGARIWSYLAGDDASLEAWLQLGFESLHGLGMEHDVVIDQLPARIERGGRQFRVEYRAVGEPLTGLLVVVSDITDEVAHERAESAQRELLAVAEHATRDRGGFLAFLQDTDELVDRTDRANLPLVELRRRIHTLKGNAALLGIASVSAVCHTLEAEIDSEGLAPDDAAWAVLHDTWGNFHDRIDRMLGVSEHRTVVVGADEYRTVLAMIGDLDLPWVSQIRRWGHDSTRSHLQRFADHAQQLAHRLGKAEIDVEIRDSDLRVDGDRFGAVWSAVIHAVRNAVDHGIELREQRVAAGKPPRARMTFCTELRGNELVIEIQDDGAGIDWQAVALRATELGLPVATARDLNNALLTKGLSTTCEITPISGRGIGMTALHAACAELGGRVELISERGRGTTVRCIVPMVRPRTRSRTSSIIQM